MPHGHWKTTTFTGALRLSGMTAPMKEPGLISAALIFTTAEMETLGASFRVTLCPSAVLTVATPPSSFSTVPRTRTPGVWAKAVVAARATKAAARVSFLIGMVMLP